MNAARICAVVCLYGFTSLAFAGVTVSSPGTGNSMKSPVHFVATGSSPACSKGVAAIGIYTAPYKLAYVVKGPKLDTKLTMKPGHYNVVVQHCDKCGWTSKQAITIHVASTTAIPRSKHVWIITEENHSYAEVIGRPSMPYYNSLASKYGLANQYYADRHSSLPARMH